MSSPELPQPIPDELKKETTSGTPETSEAEKKQSFKEKLLPILDTAKDMIDRVYQRLRFEFVYKPNRRKKGFEPVYLGYKEQRTREQDDKKREEEKRKIKEYDALLDKLREAEREGCRYIKQIQNIAEETRGWAQEDGSEIRPVGLYSPDRNIEQQKEVYTEKENLFGIEFSVGHDRQYREYTINFQNLTGEEMQRLGISDPTLRISDNSRDAHKIFNTIRRVIAVEGFSEEEVRKPGKRDELVRLAWERVEDFIDLIHRRDFGTEIEEKY